MVLGLASGTVSLSRAHDAWAAAYERARVRIVAAIGEHLLDVQYVGSTSIPGVPAAPARQPLPVRSWDCRSFILIATTGSPVHQPMVPGRGFEGLESARFGRTKRSAG